MSTAYDHVECSCGAVSPATARFCAWCGAPLGAGRERRSEERRSVTALFADLSNFSRLVATLDSEDLVAIIDPVIAALSGIVDRHGGYVEKFAGDALLALFGAPIAHEDDALRAVQAACDMHAYLTSGSVDPLSMPLRLHVGISSGPVVARTIGSTARTDYAVLGDAVVLAQRLQSLAGTGETYVDDATIALTSGHFDFEALGLRTVKGRDEPVSVHRLTGRRSRLTGATGRTLVGRDTEVDALLAALGDAVGGRGGARWVTGPAGSGKSQLLAQLRRAAGPVTTVDLVASSVGQQPYGTLQPLIEHALAARMLDVASTRERLDRLRTDRSAPASAAVTGLLLDDSAPADPFLSGLVPQALRRELQAAALGWWRDLATRGPLLVTIDNAQWLDTASADVITGFVSAANTMPAFVCLAGRGSDGRRFDEVTPLPLPPLSRESTRELVVAELGLLPSDKLVDFVHGRSDGNPLTACETVRQLAAERLLDCRNGHARVVSGANLTAVPAGLTSLLAARVDTLSDVTARVATVAAVIGPVVQLDVLTEASDAGDDIVAAAVTDLSAAGLIARIDGRFQFEPPLLRDVLYGRLTGRRRRDLHVRVAAALLHHPGGSDAVTAEHLYLAGNAARALPMLRRVADRTRRVFEHDAAARALSHALECARVAEPQAVSGLLCDLGELRVDCGEYEAAAGVFAEARKLDGDARAWAGEAGARRRRGDYAGALALLDEALARGPAGDERLVWCELAWTRSVAGDLQGSLAATDRGLELAPPVDRVAALLLLQRVRVRTLLDQLEAAAEDADQAIAILERDDDLAGLCSALRLLGDLRQRARQFGEAVDTLERGLAAARRAGLVEEMGGCLVNLGLVHGEQGDHQAASAAYARAAVVFEQAGITAGCAIAYGNRSYELFMLDEVDAARGLATQALALAEEVGNHYTAADIHHTLGLIAEQLGERAEARRQAEFAIAEFEIAGLPEAARPSRELAARMRQPVARA